MFSKDNADCPFWRGPCREHKCRLYIQVQGKHPQSDETINRFGCAFEFLPMLTLEVAQQARQAGASSDKVATEVAKVCDAVREERIVNVMLPSSPEQKIIDYNGR